MDGSIFTGEIGTLYGVKWLLSGLCRCGATPVFWDDIEAGGPHLCEPCHDAAWLRQRVMEAARGGSRA